MKLNKILFMWTISILSVLCWSCQIPHLPPPEDHSIRGFSLYLQRIIPRLLNDRIPGVQIAVIENGHIMSLMAFGLKDKGHHLPVDNATAFQAASISKTITAWAVLTLVEEQKIDLDAPVWQYVHRWKPEKSQYNPERITVRSLLSHRSGLTLTGFPGYAPGERIPSLEESLSGDNGAFYGIVHMGPARLESAPWSKYAYSGGGYSVLQLMIEEVTGMDFATYVQHAIMTPLEMRYSSFELNDAIQANWDG